MEGAVAHGEALGDARSGAAAAAGAIPQSPPDPGPGLPPGERPGDPVGTPGLRTPGTGRLRAGYALAGAVFFVAFGAWLRLGLGGPLPTRAFVDLSTTAVSVGAAALCLARIRKLPGPRRPAWRFFGLACLAWGLGNAAWTWYELVLQVSAPFPSLADLGYLPLLPLMAAGLLATMVGLGASTSRLRALLDGLTIGLAVLFAAWPWLLRPIVAYAASSDSLLAEAVAIAYPVGDLALLSMAVLAASRAPQALRGMLGYVGLALLALTVADLGFWYLTSQGAYQTGAWSDTGWLAAFILIGYAALRPIPPAANVPDYRPGLWMASIPYAAGAIAAAVAVVVQVADGGLDGFLFWDGLLVVGLVCARQFVMLAENMHLRRSVEAALAEVGKARDELEDRVRARTQELVKARDAAERASNAKSRFLATMSHELRTPLHGIIGLTGTLHGAEPGTPAAEAATTIRASGEQLLAVLNDVLDYSILESGPVVVQRAPLQPVAQLEATVELFTPRAKAKHLALLVRTAPDLPDAVLADGPHVRQVLSKLLDNAIKFTDHGTVTVSLAARRLATQWELEYTVEDTGMGITPEAKGRLFQAFMQADDSSTRSHGGSGLGLAIARRVVEGMDGSIAVDSTPGAWTKVTFTVPAPEAVMPRPPPAAAAPADLDQLRVLLAEDNPVNQKVALSMLKTIGCAADVAQDGLQAVEAARKTAYDVILMDVHMPHMDGIAAAAAIRQAERDGWHPWIVAVTADTLPEDRQLCLAAGMDDHLPKPVRLAELRDAICRGAGAAKAVAARARGASAA